MTNLSSETISLLGRKRTAARAAAVQALYQNAQTSEPIETVISQFLQHRISCSPQFSTEDGYLLPMETTLFKKISLEAVKSSDQIDVLITDFLPEEWPAERINPVLRALLKAAVAELWLPSSPPGRVLINEYLNVAHYFLGKEDVRLINGILDAIIRKVRGEFGIDNNPLPPFSTQFNLP